MKKDEFYERFLFVPIIVIIVSVLCIVFNGFERLFPKVESQEVQIVEQIESDEEVIKLKKVSKIKKGETPIDINRATAEELQRLPGIGVAKATSIVEQREKMGGFKTLDDLMCTEGIGPGVFDRLVGFICISK